MVSLALAFAGVIAVFPSTARAAAGDLSLTKTAGSVLLGGTAQFTLKATNNTSDVQYNLSLSDVLPTGVTYVGPTTPTSFGEPTVTTVDNGDGTNHQVLVWSNLIDIADHDSATLVYSVKVDPDRYPVNATVPNQATAATNTSPYVVPGFDAKGALVDGTYTASATASGSAKVSAVKITKSTDAVEGELLRGVGTNQALFTLNVTTNGEKAVGDVEVVDYLDAGLEFLGCGNYNITPAEYTGANTDVEAATGCVEPTKVETVDDRPGFAGVVFTKLTWDLGAVAKGTTVSLPYRVGIPMRANTMTFAGGTPATDGPQTANLKNNTGSSTRETVPEHTLTNAATVTGTFEGKTVEDDASAGVTSEDLTVVKEGSRRDFVRDEYVEYTLTIRTSEYVDNSELAITDIMQSGLCPVGALSGARFSDCDPTAPDPDHAPGNATITSAAPDSDGNYTVMITPKATALDHGEKLKITYWAKMLRIRASSQETSVSDDFTNNVSITGTATPRDGIGSPDKNPAPVGDTSSWTVTASAPELTKLRLPNNTADHQSTACPTDQSTLGDYVATVKDETPYRLGDQVCYLLQVRFPRSAVTRSAVLSDYLPANLELTDHLYVDQTSQDLVAGFVSSGRTAVFTFKDPVDVDADTLFQVVVAARVVKPVIGAETADPVSQQNLAKFRFTNSAGQAKALRDAVTAPFAPAAPITLEKSVTSIAGAAPGSDHYAKAGDAIGYTITVSNNSIDTSGYSTMSGIVVWDALPVGTTCADVSAITPAVTCDTTNNRISWTITGPLVRGGHTELGYTMTVPEGASVSTTYTNHAGVVSYQTPTNVTGAFSTHYPANNINSAIDPNLVDVPAADDSDFVKTHDVIVTKSNTTAITEGAVNGVNDAVVGEAITYTVDVRIPAGTSVYAGQFADALPTGVSTAPTGTVAAASFYPDAGNTATPGTFPGGVSLDTTSGALNFGSVYTNSSDTDQLFRVTIRAWLNTLSGNVHNLSRTNTASFTSTSGVGGGVFPARTGTSSVRVVDPSPGLTKSVTPAATIGGGAVTFTLKATNLAGRPSLWDSGVVDCVPAGLTVGAITPPSGTTAAKDDTGGGTNGCPAGATKITWTIGQIVGGGSLSLSYAATLKPNPSAGETFKNTATLTGSTLNNGVNDPAVERVFTIAKSATVTASPTTITKVATPTTPTIGETVTYTASIVVPKNTQVYDLSMIDTLPSGLAFGSVISATCAPNCTVTSTTLASSGTTRGVLLGDLDVASVDRTVTVVYTGTVTDIADNKFSVGLTNSVVAKWNFTKKNPTSVSATFDKASSVAVAPVKIIEPAMAIAKSVDDPTPEPGQVFTYTVKASNNARSTDLSTAYGVVISDTVPTGVVVDAPTISNDGKLVGAGANGGGTITWRLTDPLAPNASISLSYKATLAPSVALTSASLTNIASVDSYNSLSSLDGRFYRGPTSQALVRPQFPHITPTKTVASGPAYLGQAKSWTITLANDGGADARSVGAVDTLPMNWGYVADSAQVSVAGGGNTQVNPTISTAGSGAQVLTWTNLGTAPSTGTNRTIVITFSAIPKDPAAITDPGVGSGIKHTNSVTSSALDGTSADHNKTGPYGGGPATASTTIDSADVQVTKTSDAVAHQVVAGSDLKYTLTVTNNGGDTAVGPFTLTDTLPGGTGTITVAPTQNGWSCSLSGTTVSCQRTNPDDQLAKGASFGVVTITVAIPSAVASGTTYKNTATIAAQTYDPNTSNNTADVTDTVMREVDIQLKKQVSSSTVVAGGTVTYTLDVTNAGRSDSGPGEFLVTDTLPTGLTLIDAGGTDWTCPVISGTITCTTTVTAATAPKVGESLARITITAAVAANVTAQVDNSATVTGPEHSLDPDKRNNTSTASFTPDTSADLELLKKADADPWVSGSTHIYTLQLLNHGPSEAKGVAITDTLPDSVTYVPGSFTSSGSANWHCSVSVVSARQKLDCTRDGSLALSPDAVTPVEALTFQVTVKPDHVGEIYNEATVSAATYDPDKGNNTGHVTVGTKREADLALTKAGPATAVAGDPDGIEFTLTVHNFGDSDSPAPDVASGTTPITVTDTLPGGMTYVGWSGSDWTCSASDQVVTCTLGVGLLAGEDAQTLTLKAGIGSGVGATDLVNHAAVRGYLTDPKPDNNEASATVQVKVKPSLTITKTASPDRTMHAGERVTYTITVKSAGPSDATTVKLVDPLAAGLVFVGVDKPTAEWTCSTPAVNCSIDRLKAGTTAVFTVRADIGTGVTDHSIDNTATVTGDDALSEKAKATITVDTLADLRLEKSHDPAKEPVQAGDDVVFILKTTNDGPSDARSDVVLTDNLPVGMTYVSNGDGWTCAAATPDASGQVVTCGLDAGTLIAGTSSSLAMTVHVDAHLDPLVTELANHATVTSTTTPGKDGSDTDIVRVGYSADLSITKTHDAASVRVGDPLTFTLQVKNAGPSAARGVTVTDELPDGLTYVSATGTATTSAWSCSYVAPRITCTMADPLSVGDAEPVHLTATVLASAHPSVTNPAKVTSTTPDPVTSNNSTTDKVTVPAQVDLSITKTHSPEPLQVGQQATYTLTVANAGPTDDPGPVRVTDALPAGLTYVSGSGTGWTCGATGADVTCTAASGLAKKATSAITLVVGVGAAAYPSVTNTASVSSPAEDLNPKNNSATDPATVLPLYDLGLTKALRSLSGRTASWTLTVSNGGPNEAPTGAVVVDTLPAPLTFVRFSGDGWTCTASGQVVTCDHPGVIAADSSTSLVLVTRVDDGFSGKLVNAAALDGTDKTAQATARVPSADENLAYTGMNLGLGVAGLVLVLGGSVALALRPRRRTE